MELPTRPRAVHAFEVALAWVLLGVFGAISRHRRPRLGRSLLLAALRSAARSECSRVPDRTGTAQRVVAAFERASRGHRLAHSCLPRALALHRLLVLRGVQARVRLGLEPGPRPRGGHAWVECGGVPVGGDASLATRYHACRTS